MRIGDGHMRKAVVGDEITKICHTTFSDGQLADAIFSCRKSRQLFDVTQFTKGASS